MIIWEANLKIATRSEDIPKHKWAFTYDQGRRWATKRL